MQILVKGIASGTMVYPNRSNLRPWSRLLVAIKRRFLGTPHQFGQGHVIHFRESIDRPQRWALHPALDRTQLCSINPKLFINVELGKRSLISNLPQHASQGPFGT
jgi:hypothetical protein